MPTKRKRKAILEQEEAQKLPQRKPSKRTDEEAEYTMMMRERVARDILGTQSIPAFMELSPEQRDRVYRQKLITKGWIMVLDDEQDTYPLGAAVQLIIPHAEGFLGDEVLVQEATKVYWSENAFLVGSPSVPSWELLAHPGAKQYIARIKLEVNVPIGKEDRRDATQGIRDIEECERLKWVSIDIKGSSSSSVDEYIESMRETFELVAMRCRPEKGLHISKATRGSGNSFRVVEGAWQRDREGKKTGNFQEIFIEEGTRHKANRRLRAHQFDDFDFQDQF